MKILNKKVITEDYETKHLRDIIKKIDIIYIYGDVTKDFHFSSDEIVDNALKEDNNIDVLPEADLLNLSDAQILSLSNEKIHSFTNTELLDRIFQADKNRLCTNQLEILQKYFTEYKVILDQKDVQDFLNKLQKCSKLFYERTTKNSDFINRFDLTPDDILNILKQLTVTDYVENRKSFSVGHLGNNLMIFQPSTIVVENNVFEGLFIYIKIDIDESNGLVCVAVSFHETNKRSKLAYPKN